MKLVELAFFTDHVKPMADFYRNLLGAEPITQSEGMAIFKVGAAQLFIHRTYTPADGELPPTNHIAFEVEDLNTACQQLLQHGLTLEAPPRDYYWGRSAYLRDPDGHQIELIQATSAKPAPM